MRARLNPYCWWLWRPRSCRAATSFALTQIMSKASQRLIADLRVKVQGHISRLPVSFYDANKTGALVSRIMTDVEGLRNLLGTGMIDFLGGILTAVIVLDGHPDVDEFDSDVSGAGNTGLLRHRDAERFRICPPTIFRAHWEISAEGVTGRLTESISGVRVIKGYHAEERERPRCSREVLNGFSENVFRNLTFTSLTSLFAALLTGVVSVGIMYLGAQQIFSGRLMIGDLVKYITSPSAF